MVELQAGLGFGVEKFRNIFVFEIESAMTHSSSVANGVWLYQLTEKGLNASITATEAKYYKDDALK